MPPEVPWFESWFNTLYYPILYQERDIKEAEFFIGKLVSTLGIPKTELVLDLACGSGRHSTILNRLGYQVLGVDLSANAIEKAKASESESLRFKVGDMRTPQGNEVFGLVLNLFTSFGYFNSEDDNRKTLRAINQSLKPNGVLTLDFMNSKRVIENLIPYQEIERKGILFKIAKNHLDGFIVKNISFHADGKDWQFEERVQAIGKKTFILYLESCNFKVKEIWGNYALEAFEESSSERMIFQASKLN